MSRAVTAWLLVRAGGRLVGLPLARVVEVLEPGAVHAVPSRDPALRGVISVRGRLMPILDLAMLLDGADRPAVVDTGVVVEIGESRVCLLIEDAEEVLLGAGLPIPHGSTLPLAAAVARHHERLVPLLDLDALGTRIRETAPA
jgi:purine-binding chemotaxis protein CheW